MTGGPGLVALEAALEGLGRWLVRRRGLAALAMLALSAAALAAIVPRLEGGLPIDFTPQALFERDAESAAAMALRAHWGRDDNDLMVLLSGPIFSPRGLEAVAALHEGLAASPGVVQVDSLASIPVARRSPEGDVAVEPLLTSPAPRAPEEAAALRARARADPALRGVAVSPDGELATLRVRLDPALQRVAELGPAVARARAAAAASPLPPGFSVDSTGVPAVRVDIVDQLVRDQARFFPLSAALFAVVLALIYRGPVPGLLPLFAVGLAVLWSTGLLLGAGVTFNVLSALVPTLVLVIGLSDGIHLLNRYREELAEGAGDAEAAMGRTLRHLAPACFLTSFTTAVGFGSLAAASSPAIREFGLHCAISVLVAWLAVTLALPALLAWVPPARALGSRRQGRRVEVALARLDALVAARPGAALGACAALTAAALVVGAGVGTDSHILELFPEEHPSRAAFDAVIEHGGGVIPAYAHLEAEAAGAFLEPAILARVGALEDQLMAREEVRWSASPASVLAGVHLALTGEEQPPTDRSVVEQELFVLELGGAEGALRAVVDEASRHARVLLLTTDAGGHRFLELADAIEREGAAIFEGAGVRVRAAGDGVVASAGVHRIIDDLVGSVGLALLLIGLTLWALFRDWRLAAISMIPNALPLVFTVAALGVAGQSIQTGNVISFAVAVGLAVDDTIHFLVRLREERAGGRDTAAAIRHTFRGAGPALVYTSALLVVGLGALVMSDVVAIRHFGALVAVTLVAALGTDLVALPAGLHLLGERALPRRDAMIARE